MLTFTDDKQITSWGRVVRRTQRAAQPQFVSDLLGWASADKEKRLAIGLGRSYGDTALFSQGRLLVMPALDRLIAFDEAAGLIKVQAGVSLDALLRFVVPRGWFVWVTPGTRRITIGGAVANDVHGKNHGLAGTFGSHVRSLTLLRSDMGIVEVSSAAHPELFAATIGGLGLTGIILDVTFQLCRIESSSLDVETLPLRGLDDFFALNEESHGQGWEHTVAWIDCTQRGSKAGLGVYTRANWSKTGGLSTHGERVRRIPLETPGWLINPVSLKSFNALYRTAQLLKPRTSLVHYPQFFHPLDTIEEWNKLYGASGFFQYQCVVPLGAREALRELLNVIASAGEGSALVVLKTFGEVVSPGMLSFPRAGYTLALDFRNRGAETLQLLARLDAIVQGVGGALYPAKDGRMPREMFERSFPRLAEFLGHRDPACGSDFMTRMGL